MKNSARHLVRLLLFAATGLSFMVVEGCYTQLASNKGDYYGYTGRVRHRRTVQSDTIVNPPASIAQAQPAAVRYATTYKGDTVFIDEDRSRTDYAYPGGTTIINNYNDGYLPYDSYSYPRPSYGLSIGFGWPYHSWYSPWYSYPSYYPNDWYSPGFYPPLYDCYAPFYAYGYSYGYGYGGGHYGQGYYGYGSYDNHGFYDGIRTRTPHRGRVGSGEGRAGGSTTTGQLPSVIATGGSRQEGMPVSSAAVASSMDRNAPIHAVAPGTGGPVTHIEPATHTEIAATRTTQSAAAASGYGASVATVSRTANVASSNVSSASVSRSDVPSGHHIVVVRRGGFSNGVASVNSRGSNVGRSFGGYNGRVSSSGYGSRTNAAPGQSGPARSEPTRVRSAPAQSAPESRSNGSRNDSPSPGRGSEGASHSRGGGGEQRR